MHMQLKKIFLTIVLLMITTPSWASTWYLRTDGGAYGTTSTTCNGQTDAAFTGSNGPNCAVNSWVYLLRHYSDNTTLIGTTRIVSGDTVIVGNSVASPGAFRVGYDSTNIWASCNAAFPENCRLEKIPNGTPANPTKIYGRGYDTGCPGYPNNMAQIWGGMNVSQVLNIGSDTTLKCLEITDHSGSVYRRTNGVGRIDNDPTQDLIKVSSNVEVSLLAQTGLLISYAGGVTLDHLYIHGLGDRCVKAFGLSGTTNVTDVRMEGCAMSGWEADDGPLSHDGTPYTGTVNWTRVQLRYIGCGERYLATPGGAAANTPHDCFGQKQGGYGDGIAFDGDSGNWNFDNCDISFNMSDGIDITYSNNGTAYIRRLKCQGNVGACYKSLMPFSQIENSMLLGNCGWWYTNPYAFGDINAPGRSGSNCNHDGQCQANENFTNCSADCLNEDFCRPTQPTDVNMYAQTNRVLNVYNSTLTGNGDTIISALNNNGGDCGTGSAVTYINNVFYGGADHNEAGADQSIAYYAECSLGSLPVVTQRNNVCYNGKSDATNCSGSGSAITNPNLVGPIQNAYQAYFSGADYIPNFYPTANSSNLINRADTTITLTGGSADINGSPRGASWDIGAVEFGGTPVGCTATVISNCDLSAVSSGGTSGTCHSGYTGTCTYSCAGGVWSSINNSCTINTPPPSCSATTIGNCVLPLTNSGSSAGSCSAGYSGTCTYSCATGVWNFVSNSCTITQVPSCNAQTINNCDLPLTADGVSAGTCSTGYTGSCSYNCSNQVWSQLNNSCALPVSPTTAANETISGTVNFSGFVKVGP